MCCYGRAPEDKVKNKGKFSQHQQRDMYYSHRWSTTVKSAYSGLWWRFLLEWCRCCSAALVCYNWRTDYCRILLIRITNGSCLKRVKTTQMHRSTEAMFIMNEQSLYLYVDYSQTDNYRLFMDQEGNSQHSHPKSKMFFCTAAYFISSDKPASEHDLTRAATISHLIY